MTKITIPENCVECYGTEFQVKNCPYKLKIELEETLAYFKETFMLDMTDFGLNSNAIIKQLKPQAKKCIADIDERAKIVIQERERKEHEKRMSSLEENMEKTQKMLQKLLEKEERTQIFREEKEMETPVIEVKQEEKPKLKYTFHKDDEEPDEDNDPDELIPHGGWMKYLRNVKEENIPKYMDNLVEKHPDLKEEAEKLLDGEPTDAIKITDNSSGNKMIEYREMKRRADIEE